MKKTINLIRRKFNSRSGETLTETLVSVLIISIASVGLAAMISTASNINSIAREYDKNLDAAEAKMESSAGSGEISVTVTVDGGSKGQVTFGDIKEPASNPLQLQSSDDNLGLYRYSYTVPEN